MKNLSIEFISIKPKVRKLEELNIEFDISLAKLNQQNEERTSESNGGTYGIIFTFGRTKDIN